MNDWTKLLRDSLPEISGGLVVTAILAILASLYSILGLWLIPIIIGILVIVIFIGTRLSRKYRKINVAINNTPSISSETSQTELKTESTILFVDDDIDILYSFIRALENAGIEVITAANVEQAIQVLQSNQPLDLIVTDLIMPYGYEYSGTFQHSGLEVIKTAKKLRKNTPVMCLSVSGHDKDLEQKLLKLGVIEHLSKPILPSEFIQRVKLNILVSQNPTQHELIADEIGRRSLEVKSGNPYNRIRALWALGEIGHHDVATIKLLENIAKEDSDANVRKASKDALKKVRSKL